MPKPRKNETEESFIARCVPEVIREGRDQQQAVAVCYSTWNQHRGKSGAYSDTEGMDDKE
jgi:hypothetical protein